MEFISIKICLMLLAASGIGAGIGIISLAIWLRSLSKREMELSQQLKELENQLL